MLRPADFAAMTIDPFKNYMHLSAQKQYKIPAEFDNFCKIKEKCLSEMPVCCKM
jgi:hypothetical protein